MVNRAGHGKRFGVGVMPRGCHADPTANRWETKATFTLRDITRMRNKVEGRHDSSAEVFVCLRHTDLCH